MKRLRCAYESINPAGHKKQRNQKLEPSTDEEDKSAASDDGTSSLEVVQGKMRLANDKLCHPCKSIFHGKAKPVLLSEAKYEGSQERTEYKYYHHQNMRGLRTAVKKGCPLCILMLRRFERLLNWPPVNISEFLDQPPIEDFQLRLRFGKSSNGGLTTYTDYQSIHGLRSSPWSLGSLEPPSSSSSDSFPNHVASTRVENWNLPLALKWLDTCNQHHSLCRAASSTWYPTRLLDISNGQVRLIITQESEPVGRYATLSHCWGLNTFITTTPENLEKMKQGIPPSALTKTFQHAVEIARSLSLRYLWIDSLCIIQGCPEDWQVESAMMYDVYRNSYCNIAATSALNGDQGCFFDRNPLDIMPLQIKIRKGVTIETGEVISGTFNVHTTLDIWSANMEHAPLLTRAWVAQERVLAPRIIHATREQLIWECNEMTACDSFPEGFPELHHPNFTLGTAFRGIARCSLKNAFAQLTQRPGKNPTWHYWDFWKALVGEYTSLSLTNGQDKLPAMSGIATIFQRATGWKYYAGLWDENFAYQLFWHIRDSDSLTRPKHRPEPKRAPTWSWMSTDGKIETTIFAQNNAKLIATINKILVVPKNRDDIFGQVIHGELSMTGHLRSGDFFLAVKELVPKDTDVCVFQFLETRPGSTVTADCHLDHAGWDFLPGQLFCFTIWDISDGDTYYGLLLKSTPTEGIFVRVGIFNIRNNRQRDWMLTHADSSTDSWGTCDDGYEEWDLGPEQTITIT